MVGSHLRILNVPTKLHPYILISVLDNLTKINKKQNLTT